MKLIEVCNICQKPIQLRFQTAAREFYVCGHSKAKDEPAKTLTQVDYFDLAHKDEAYEYQKVGYEFARNSDFNVVIGDAMGLGKTIQAEMCLKNHPEELIPSLVVVKSATIGNWLREIVKWVDADPLAAFPIIGKAFFIPLGFKQYIISMDSLH